MRICSLLFLCGILTSSSCFADPLQQSRFPETSGALTLRGFGTLGVARSSSAEAEFIRDQSQPNGISNHWSSRIDSILGAQANWRFAPHFEAVGQIASRYRFDGSRRPELMLGFVQWAADSQMPVRVGRIGADFLMDADSRLVGYSYLTARPPPDYFIDLYFSYFDGADISITWPAGDGLLRLKGYAGRTGENGSGGGLVWETRRSPLAGLVLDYFQGPWQWRASVSRIRHAGDLPIEPMPELLRSTGLPSAMAAADFIGVKDTSSTFLTVGTIYDKGPVRLQGMLNSIRHESGAIQNSWAGYVLAAYRLEQFTPYVGLARSKSTPRTFSTGLPNTGMGGFLNEQFALILGDTETDQTTCTLGARWDIGSTMSLKAQWDTMRGPANSRLNYRNEKFSTWNGKTNVLGLTLDFVF